MPVIQPHIFAEFDLNQPAEQPVSDPQHLEDLNLLGAPMLPATEVNGLEDGNPLPQETDMHMQVPMLHQDNSSVPVHDLINHSVAQSEPVVAAVPVIAAEETIPLPQSAGKEPISVLPKLTASPVRPSAAVQIAPIIPASHVAEENNMSEGNSMEAPWPPSSNF